MEAMEERTSYVKPEEARKFAQVVLEGNGVPAGQAGIVARCPVQADLRGVDTHGCNRLPSYMERIRQGVLEPNVQVQVKQITPVVSQIDGKNGFMMSGAIMLGGLSKETRRHRDTLGTGRD